MGDFNPNAPSPLGQETRFFKGREIPFPINVVALGERIRPGATTITHMHPRLPVVRGAPGIALEIVSSLAPAQTVSYFYPGSDTGDTTTNFQDNAGAALNFGDISNPYQTAVYGRNSVALARTQSALAYFRGNNAGALAGRRILRVRVGAAIMNRLIVGTGISGNDPAVAVTGQVVMGGNTYIGNTRYVPKIDHFFRFFDLADWPLSPSTNIPWTVTEVDNIISAANADTMGINLYGKADIQGLRSSAIWVEVTHVLENRMGFLYQRGHLRSGWDRYALGSTSAEAANTEYYGLIGTMTGSWSDLFSVAALDVTPTSDIPSTGPTDATHDHRQGVGVALTGPGGVGRDATTQSIGTDNEQLQMLYEAGGPTILGESQPYGKLNNKDVYSGGVANIGQQITTPGAGLPAAYVAVQFTVGWQDQTTVPDRPLTIQVRHGGGAISGGGTLDMTATLYPADMADGTFRDYFVKFDGQFVPIIGTQYHVLFSSTAKNGRGYRLLRYDTRSDDIVSGSGTTLANIEGATQGGQTDSYVEAGAALTRYDLGVMLIAAPAAPANFQATAVPAAVGNAVGNVGAGCVGTTYPPYVRLTWNATALGASFGAYRLYRRRRAVPALPWTEICEITVPTLGPTAAQVEANWREYRDYEATWAVTGSAGENGWDYALTVYNTSTNLESVVGSQAVYGVQPPAPGDDWQVSNYAPYLNWPLRTQGGVDSDVQAGPNVYPQVAGRDFNIVRVPGTVPGRSYRLHWAFQDPTSGYSDEWPELRGPRAAARSGLQVAVMRVRGDRHLGIVSEPKTSQSRSIGTTAEADLFVTSNESALTAANMPAGLVLNGTTQYVSTPQYGLLTPFDGPFSIVMAAVVPGGAGVRVFLAKRVGAQGFQFWGNNAAELRFYREGSLGSDDLVVTWPTDSTVRVAAATCPGLAGGTTRLYRDGAVVGTSPSNVGSITNTEALVAGAASTGTAPSAINPLQSWAYYPRVLTADEVLSVSRYLLGHAMQTVPVGPNAFYDLRDKRCWDGASTNVNDLSGNNLTAATVASPVPRGTPWPLAELDIGR